MLKNDLNHVVMNEICQKIVAGLHMSTMDDFQTQNPCEFRLFEARIPNMHIIANIEINHRM